MQQIQDKIARKQRINSEEAAIVAEWNEQQDRAKELDIEKKAQAYQREVDSRSQLQDQVGWLYSGSQKAEKPDNALSARHLVSTIN